MAARSTSPVQDRTTRLPSVLSTTYATAVARRSWGSPPSPIRYTMTGVPPMLTLEDRIPLRTPTYGDARRLARRVGRTPVSCPAAYRKVKPPMTRRSARSSSKTRMRAPSGSPSRLQAKSVHTRRESMAWRTPGSSSTSAKISRPTSRPTTTAWCGSKATASSGKLSALNPKPVMAVRKPAAKTASCASTASRRRPDAAARSRSGAGIRLVRGWNARSLCQVLFEPGDHVAPCGQGLLLVVGRARVVVEGVHGAGIHVELVGHARRGQRLIQVVAAVVWEIVRVRRVDARAGEQRRELVWIGDFGRPALATDQVDAAGDEVLLRKAAHHVPNVLGQTAGLVTTQQPRQSSG